MAAAAIRAPHLLHAAVCPRAIVCDCEDAEPVEGADHNRLARRVEGGAGELLLRLVAGVVEALEHHALLVVEADGLVRPGRAHSLAPRQRVRHARVAAQLPMGHTTRRLVEIEAVDALIDVTRDDGGAAQVGGARHHVGVSRAHLDLPLLKAKHDLVWSLLGPHDACDGGLLLEFVADRLLISPFDAKLRAGGRGERSCETGMGRRKSYAGLFGGSSRRCRVAPLSTAAPGATARGCTMHSVGRRWHADVPHRRRGEAAATGRAVAAGVHPHLVDKNDVVGLSDRQLRAVGRPGHSSDHVRPGALRVCRLGGKLVPPLAILIAQMHNAVSRHDSKPPVIGGPGDTGHLGDGLLRRVYSLQMAELHPAKERGRQRVAAAGPNAAPKTRLSRFVVEEMRVKDVTKQSNVSYHVLVPSSYPLKSQIFGLVAPGKQNNKSFFWGPSGARAPF
eukprot:scaffold14161_cov112-Isochrysis_galbana.AAC.1